MYLVIGNENCSNCEMVKGFLEKNDVIFTYKKMTQFDEEKQAEYKEMARLSNQMSYPIIIKDDKIVQFSDIKELYSKQVVKRDGKIIKFEKSKITNAINKAMLETSLGLDEKLSESIAETILNEFENYSSVDTIQDMVEENLMTSNRKDVAKRYIIYRNERDKERPMKNTNKKSNQLITDEFISKYKHLPNPMKQLGSFVYYRTYSRWLPQEKRREYWYETIRRAVEYNCSLSPTTREEAEKLFDNIFNLRQFLSGRSLWVAGTEVAYKYPMSNYNCSFEVIDSLESFSDLFYLLMLGTGFGFRPLKFDIDKLPKFRTNVDLIHQDYTNKQKQDREDSTSLTFRKNQAKITIGDSKEGWTQSLEHYLNLLTNKDYKKIDTIIIDYDNVRRKGERLNTFGGTASGHESIKTMFIKIHKIIKNISLRENSNVVKLKGVDCLDICNIIGENVVVGGKLL